MTGTAIRLPGSTRTAWPLLTDVSVQDYWRLRSAGHEPVGLVAATAVVFASAARDTRLRRARTTRQNQELERAEPRRFSAARETVRARLLGQVVRRPARTGAVGVELRTRVHREKFSLASSICSPTHAAGWHRGRLGHPVLRPRPQRRRAPRLGDHDARGGHRDPPGAEPRRRRRSRPRSGWERR